MRAAGETVMAPVGESARAFARVFVLATDAESAPDAAPANGMERLSRMRQAYHSRKPAPQSAGAEGAPGWPGSESGGQRRATRWATADEIRLPSPRASTMTPPTM